MSPYSEQSLSYWIVICFSQDILVRHGFKQIDMLWIPYLSDYLFWKFTYLVMVILRWAGCPYGFVVLMQLATG